MSSVDEKVPCIFAPPPKVCRHPNCVLWQQVRSERPDRAALRHALEQVYAGEQSVETDAVLDQLDTLGYRLVER